MDNKNQKAQASIFFLAELERNVHINKYCHFYEAKRNKRLNVIFGVPVISINISRGSVFFFAIKNDLTEFAKWIGAILALVAAGLGGVVTFFNFSKQFEGHSKLANRYLSLGRECQRILATYDDDLLDLQGLSQELEKLNNTYKDINVDSETYPNSPASYTEALKLEAMREKGLNKRYGREILPDAEEDIAAVEKLVKNRANN
jgi:hypothetical protein